MENKKIYILDMFPYPSGNGLHVGHCVGYIATDIYARHKKQLGFNVLHPFGFDSFGLPTEEYAIKVGKTPQVVTEENIAIFKNQLSLLDLDLDWDTEIWTSNPDYYKWTQWIFLLLYNSWFNPDTNKAEPIETCPYSDLDSYRLAYKSTAEVNWCEGLGTVLSNDEIVDGFSARGNHPVIQKALLQWFLRITPYKEILKNDLDKVEWKGKILQSNWIDNLHDIVFSRQRKWGEPIPIEGETDTMPSFAGSNWYFFRYLDNHNDDFFCGKDKQLKWLPVDVYVGGAEHTTGHVLYARFITKVLFDLGHSVVDEPFKKIINVGLMMGEDGKKMSKSKGNVVIPDDVIKEYGIDAFRLWMSFIAPFEEVKVWDKGGIKGCAKFLRKFEDLKHKLNDEIYTEQIFLATTTYKKVADDIDKFSFNTAIPRFMIFLNTVSKDEYIGKSAYKTVLSALRPFVPDYVSRIDDEINN